MMSEFAGRQLPNRHRLWRFQTRAAPYLFVLPFAAIFLAFLFYPLVVSIGMSLRQYAGPRAWRFVGLENYRFLAKDFLFWIAAANTFAFTTLFLLIQIPASLGLALLLNRPAVWFRPIFRLAFVLPFLMGQVFVAVLFSVMLAPRYGLLNRVIGLLPGLSSDINWRTDPRLALAAIVLASLWLSVGWGMIYFLAALQTVDRELYDAAAVDGAGRWWRFVHVTLPGIRHVLIFLVLSGTVSSLQLFELPYVFFQGLGPRLSGMTIVQYLVVSGFDSGDLGLASAVGWTLVLLITAIAFLQLKLSGAANES